jgi:hypothetical protein
VSDPKAMVRRRQALEIVGDWDPHFPVQAFFNAISDDSLLDIVGHLVGRQGAGINDCVCLFPSDLDPGEVPFEGVRFSLFDDKVVISLSQFADWLDHVGASYCQAYPSQAHRMTARVIEFRQSLAAESPPSGTQST